MVTLAHVDKKMMKKQISITINVWFQQLQGSMMYPVYSLNHFHRYTTNKFITTIFWIIDGKLQLYFSYCFISQMYFWIICYSYRYLSYDIIVLFKLEPVYIISLYLMCNHSTLSYIVRVCVHTYA